ncbi:hypothetical protein HWV62_17224 [Athelia sp. TMB]|nr:hypothetical protein HWV62_17224 [Athelia sp. TMB]
MRRRNRRSANPLPPVMPIARHRQQDVFQFEESKFNSYSGSPNHSNRGTWYSGQHLATPSPMPSGSGSDSSLVQKEMDPFLGSAPPSPGLHRASDQSLGFRPRMSFEEGLSRPSPAFRNGSPGSSRSSTPVSGTPAGTSQSEHVAALQPNAPNPHPLAASTSAHERNSPPRSRSPAAVPRPRSPNQGGHPIRPRPGSMVSTTSRASRGPNNIRGAPHGPHSNVQIILPAPLAPELSPYGWHAPPERRGSQMQMATSDNRRSVVDQWAGLAAQRDEPSRQQKDDRKKKPTKTGMAPASDDARLSIASSGNTHSSSSSSNPSNPFSTVNAAISHRSSQVYNSSPLSTSRERAPAPPPSAFQANSPPAVPTMPSVYNRFTDVERGRQMGDGQAPVVPEKSNIEQRRSASRDRPVFFSPSPASRNNSRTRE